eukprot:1590373-Prymnesium_polylepis.1
MSVADGALVAQHRQLAWERYLTVLAHSAEPLDLLHDLALRTTICLRSRKVVKLCDRRIELRLLLLVRERAVLSKGRVRAPNRDRGGEAIDATVLEELPGRVQAAHAAEGSRRGGDYHANFALERAATRRGCSVRTKKRARHKAFEAAPISLVHAALSTRRPGDRVDERWRGEPIVLWRRHEESVGFLQLRPQSLRALRKGSLLDVLVEDGQLVVAQLHMADGCCR